MPRGRPRATAVQLASNATFAGQLRALLKQRGWKITDLSEAIGKERSYSPPRAWIAGRSLPVGANLLAVQKLLAGVTGPAPPTPVITAGGNPLSFVVSGDGTARIRLDVLLPIERAMPLLRLLLDAHIVDPSSD
jgi:hypothetical protein